MKTNNKIIIYDDTCPMCSAYTKSFVHLGLLKKENRLNFSTLSQNISEKIDMNKSRNEIPLLEISTGRVWYGIDALLEILSQKIPLIKKIGNFKPVKWFLYKLYKFISYNRRVIVACTEKTNTVNCEPDFNIKYRLAFLGVFVIFNTLMLYPLYKLVLFNSMFNSVPAIQFQSAHFAFVLVNIISAFTLSKRRGFEYIGQVNMMALEVILLTIPLMLLNKMNASTVGINNFYLGFLTMIVITEYIRRMRYAGIFPGNKKIIALNILAVAGFMIYLIS